MARVRPKDHGKIVDSIKLVESIYINLNETDETKQIVENSIEKLFLNKINTANQVIKENQPSVLSNAVAKYMMSPIKM